MKSYTLNMVIMVLILFIPQIGLAFITPCLPEMSKAVSLPMTSIMASYAIGMGFGQILWGTFSDSLGRKNLMLLGLLVFSLSSILITIVKIPAIVTILRLAQGFSTGSMFSITTAIMCDQYKSNRSLIGSIAVSELGFGVAWVILPFCGGIIQYISAKSWKLNFYFMAGYVAVVLLLSAKYLTETREEIKEKYSMKSFFIMFKNPVFLIMSVWILLPNAFFLVFNSIAPSIMMNILNQNINIIGVSISSLGVGYCIAIVLNLIILRKLNSNKIISIFLIVFCCSALVQLILASLNYISIITLFFPMIINVMAWCIMFPHITAKAMQEYPNYSGTCASNFGFIFYTGAGLGTYLFNLCFSHTFFGITLFVFILSLIAIILLIYYLLNYNGKIYRRSLG